jgi:rubrerythrin
MNRLFLRGEKERDIMRKMTEKNLNDAYAGESMAHMKYTIWADKAEQEGKPQVARMFRAIAYAERVHATNHWRTLGNIMGTKDNLQHAIDGENFEVDEMYPAYKAVAELQEEKGAVRSTHWALETEKVHAKMYEAAKQAVESGKDASGEQIWVCPVCGYTGEGEGPDLCPVCNAKKSTFKRF